MQRPRLPILASLLGLFSLAAVVRAQSSAPMTSDVERVSLHHSDEWADIAAHLPSPDTASAATLEMAGDVLRARRFPEDALDYYGYAIERGGKVSTLLNKMGVVRLELRQISLAHELFLRVVHEEKKNAAAWNNLGVTEFVSGRSAAAIADYHHATALDKHSAVYLSNLGMAYFKKGDVDSARQSFAAALAMNSHIMQVTDMGGDSAHVIDGVDYPKLCFEMARLSAKQQKMADFRLWLARAADGGFDVSQEMAADPSLAGLLRDPEVQMILSNQKQMSKRNVATVKSVPGLGPAQNFN